MNPNIADLVALSRLLDEGMELRADDREAWLARLPPEDAHLADRLREMLARQAGLEMDARLPTLPAIDDRYAREQPGARVGAYRLLREIGRGGMGTVWLAARADGAFDRELALKLPHVQWTDGLAHRMQREWRIAALLEHPRIARLYDAGVDEHGRPFIAMEYIEGRAIDVHCDAHGLGVPARLELVVQVAGAVAYAHGRLVIHRDLKPANVLVDAAGQVHLLDFGIATVIGDLSHEANPADQGRMMTPSYASPEQLAGLPVGVATDVYSLGVLLHRLLAGTLPRTPGRATFGAIEGAAVEGNLAPASTLAGDATTARALRGEVDEIIAKAMAHDAGQRYATADALAQDIERHLRGECVLAHKDSGAYRLRKALRRHWAGYAATGAVMVAVIAGAGIATAQARRASVEAERARVVKEFVVELFKLNSPQGTTSAELRKLPIEFFFEQGGRLIDRKFAGQPGTRAELFGVLGHIFSDMGASQQAATYAAKQESILESMTSDTREERVEAWMLLAQAQYDLEQFPQARDSLARAVALARPGSQRQLGARVQLARARFACCEQVIAEQELSAMEAELQRAKPGANVVRALAMNLRADRLFADGKDMEAIRLRQAAIAEAEAAEGELSRTAVDIRLDLAEELARHDRNREAEETLEAALGSLRRLGITGDVRAAYAQSGFTAQRVEAGTMPYAQARSSVEHVLSSLAADERLLPRSVKANIQLSLAQILFVNGDIARAEPVLSEALEVLLPEAKPGRQRARLVDIQAGLAAYAGRHASADSLFREAIRQYRDAGEPAESTVSAAEVTWLSWNLQMQGRFKEALAALDSFPDSASGPGRAASPLEGNEPFDDARADIELDAGDSAGALALISARSVAGDRTGRWLDYRKITRGAALCRTGNAHEGLQLLRQAIASDAQRSFEFSPFLARARALAGLCAAAAGQSSLARQLSAQVQEAFRAQPGVSPYFKAPGERLVRLLARHRQ